MFGCRLMDYGRCGSQYSKEEVANMQAAAMASATHLCLTSSLQRSCQNSVLHTILDMLEVIEETNHVVIFSRTCNQLLALLLKALLLEGQLLEEQLLQGLLLHDLQKKKSKICFCKNTLELDS